MNSCSILWCGKYKQNWENEMHSHNYFQLIGIISGSGTVFVEDTPSRISAGTVYLFRPGQRHAIHQDKTGREPLSLFDVKFLVGDPSMTQLLSGMDNVIACKDFPRFSRHFGKLIEESARQQLGYFDMVNCYLTEMIIHLAREKTGNTPPPCMEQDVMPVKNYRGVEIGAILQYIDNNFHRPIALEELTDMAGVNKTTLISIMKEVCGTTPIRYITSIRLKKAKELLLHTDTSISEISYLVGFQSIHYFSRVFKANEGCSPLEYRVRNAQSRYFTFSSNVPPFER